ncbi:MAG TPA: T9SS type A sorting domain-containing protein, partial [Chitinophagales bacterium]|nr:T9SS type A sorting domain-containing protein [Chitinophagales bacterium]
EKNPQTYSLQAYDVTGAVRYQQQLQLNQGEHTINMDISSLPAGYYVLSVTNPVNRVTYEEKFVKQ